MAEHQRDLAREIINLTDQQFDQLNKDIANIYLEVKKAPGTTLRSVSLPTQTGDDYDAEIKKGLKEIASLELKYNFQLRKERQYSSPIIYLIPFLPQEDTLNLTLEEDEIYCKVGFTMQPNGGWSRMKVPVGDITDAGFKVKDDLITSLVVDFRDEGCKEEWEKKTRAAVGVELTDEEKGAISFSTEVVKALKTNLREIKTKKDEAGAWATTRIITDHPFIINPIRFPCPICRHSFKHQGASLMNHLRKKHSITESSIPQEDPNDR